MRGSHWVAPDSNVWVTKRVPLVLQSVMVHCFDNGLDQ